MTRSSHSSGGVSSSEDGGGLTFGVLEDLGELLASVRDLTDTDSGTSKVKKSALSLLEGEMDPSGRVGELMTDGGREGERP